LAFVGTASAPLSTNFYTARIDHEITKKWHSMAAIPYYQTGGLRRTGAQYDLRSGTPKATSTAPTDRDTIIAD
jgi:hypothetical protein